MPRDPETGKRLPGKAGLYAGEPGAPADAPPAPGGPGGDLPPPGGPGGGPPPPAGPEAGATPDQVMEADEEEAGMRVEAVAAMAPEPTKPYSKKAIETLANEFNEAVDALGGGDLPDVEVNLEGEKGNKWSLPLPPEIFVPVYALGEAMKLLPDPEYAEKYAFDPTALTDDPALRKLSGQLSKMGGDKGLIEAMSQPMGGPAEGGEQLPPPQPNALSEEDEQLAAAMQ